MSDTNFGPGHSIRVQLDPEILREIIYGPDSDREPRDEKERTKQQLMCSLREHQVYRLMRHIVSQLNVRLKGRRERFKLVEEGEGLILEYAP